MRGSNNVWYQTLDLDLDLLDKWLASGFGVNDIRIEDRLRLRFSPLLNDDSITLPLSGDDGC